MTMVTKNELQEIGFGPSQSSDIIRKAKCLMVKKGYGYYNNRRLGCVLMEAVEEILGISLSESQVNKNA